MPALSGGSSSDPRTPAALPGLPPPFQTVAVIGAGGLTAGIDAYGDIVDLRAPGPAGRALIDNPHERQAAGTVAAATGIVPRVSVAGEPALPLWRADSVRQRYLPGTGVLRTAARFGGIRVEIECAANRGDVGCITGGGATSAADVSFDSHLLGGRERIHLDDGAARRIVGAEIVAGRRWIRRARPLGPGAPAWARAMYARSLLVLRALSDRRSGAVAAGARDGWAYVWPRDAGAVAIALASAGYRAEARRVARFLLGLSLGAAARFYGDGRPVPGRSAEGDASGWVAAAARAAGLPSPPLRYGWRDRADYQEGAAGEYLGNAIALGSPVNGLEREQDNPSSGLDSAAAWAVRPFPRPGIFPAVRLTLLRLVARSGPYGVLPSADWDGGEDPWTAPTAWTAWSLAALDERRPALGLLADLRRAATPAGLLPERVDARTGVPRSTAPLAWSHAFAILALRQLWP